MLGKIPWSGFLFTWLRCGCPLSSSIKVCFFHKIGLKTIFSLYKFKLLILKCKTFDLSLQMWINLFDCFVYLRCNKDFIP